MIRESLKKGIIMYKKIPKQGKASFWFLLCSFLQKGMSMITTPIFTRILPTDAYGQLGAYYSWSSIIGAIVSLNLFAGVYTQGLVKFESEKYKYSSSLQGLCATLTLAWGIVYFSAREYWNHLLSLTTQQMMAMLLTIWLSASFSFWSVEQRVEMNYTKLVIIILLASILQPVVSIVFVLYSEDKVMARIMGALVVELILYAWTFFAQLSKGRQFVSKKYWAYALRFNLPLLPHYLSGSVLNASDRIMISRMIGDDQAGIYTLAYSVSLIMTIFNNALLQTIEPWIYQKIKDKKIDELSKVAYPTFVFIALINLLLIIVAPEIISIFAPEEYKEGMWIIPSVALSVFFQFLYSFFATFEFYYEKTVYITCATMGGALLNIILNLIFIGRFGYIAAGYTTLFSYMVYAAFHYLAMKIIVKHYFGGANPYNMKVIAIIGFTSILIGLSVMFVYDYYIIRYAIILVALVFCIWKKDKIGCYIKRILSFKQHFSKVESN